MIAIIDNQKDILPLIEATMPEDIYKHAVCVLSNNRTAKDRTLFGYYFYNKLVGCCGYFREGPKYWISWTAVLPSYQGKGIGQELLNKVFEDLNNITDRVYVETYEHPDFRKAINFYWKNGFKLCGILEDYLDTGDACLYLRKWL
jgi:ribosomal protein S18 acetylase RimI-like enzyme